MYLLGIFLLKPVYYSLESLLMAILASGLLLVVISVCLYSVRIMQLTGYRLLSFFSALAFLRIVIPVALPFSIPVILPEGAAGVMGAMRTPFLGTAGFYFSIINLLGWSWIAGVVVQAFRYVRNFITSRKFLRKFAKNITSKEPYAGILRQICAEHRRKNLFQVMETNAVSVPMIYGIFKPVILIPEGFCVVEEDLYYILKHEAAHFFHHDLSVKFCMNILRIVYWWNPAVYKFGERLEILLELHVDDQITKGDKRESCQYAGSITRAMKLAVTETDQRHIPPCLTISMRNTTPQEFSKRFVLMINPKWNGINLVSLAFTTAALCIFVFSYRFIPGVYPVTYETDVEWNGETEVIPEEDSEEVDDGEAFRTPGSDQ